MAAAVLMLLMFVVQAVCSFQLAPSTHEHKRQGIFKLTYFPFIATLLIAFVFPNSSLDASMVSRKGANLGARQTPAQSGSPGNVATSSTIPQSGNNGFNNQGPAMPANNPIQEKIDLIRKSDLINVTEDNFTIVNTETYLFPERYAGKEISMLGLVYKEPSMRNDQFALGRYVITCCSADASFAGFLCEYKNAGDIKEGNWLTIRGTLKVGQYEGGEIPVILISTFNTADREPENPYVY
jgi:putative membrane protein